MFLFLIFFASYDDTPSVCAALPCSERVAQEVVSRVLVWQHRCVFIGEWVCSSSVQSKGGGGLSEGLSGTVLLRQREKDAVRIVNVEERGVFLELGVFLSYYGRIIRWRSVSKYLCEANCDGMAGPNS